MKPPQAASLSGIAFVEGLDNSERERLAGLCRWTRYDARQQIFATVNDFYFTVEGRVGHRLRRGRP